MIREIVLDTETTGLDPKDGHRIIEIGCIELIKHLPTGQHYHTFINPQREIEEAAVRVHGLKTEFLKDHPIFLKIVDPFLEFIGTDPLIIHNASFDIGFINAELERLCRPTIPLSRAIDTVKLARQKFPGSPASLDALCKRFSIDLASRTKHGALIDSELLARVYLELIGGRQTMMSLATTGGQEVATHDDSILSRARPLRPSRNFKPSAAELELHQEFVATLKNPLWQKLKPTPSE